MLTKTLQRRSSLLIHPPADFICNKIVLSKRSLLITYSFRLIICKYKLLKFSLMLLAAIFVQVQKARLSDSIFTSSIPLGGPLPNGPHCVLLLMGRLVLVCSEKKEEEEVGTRLPVLGDTNLASQRPRRGNAPATVYLNCPACLCTSSGFCYSTSQYIFFFPRPGFESAPNEF